MTFNLLIYIDLLPFGPMDAYWSHGLLLPSIGSSKLLIYIGKLDAIGAPEWPCEQRLFSDIQAHYCVVYRSVMGLYVAPTGRYGVLLTT